MSIDAGPTTHPVRLRCVRFAGISDRGRIGSGSRPIRTRSIDILRRPLRPARPAAVGLEAAPNIWSRPIASSTRLRRRPPLPRWRAICPGKAAIERPSPTMPAGISFGSRCASAADMEGQLNGKRTNFKGHGHAGRTVRSPHRGPQIEKKRKPCARVHGSFVTSTYGNFVARLDTLLGTIRR